MIDHCSNVVQVEFFHPSGQEGPILVHYKHEGRVRLWDGSPYKTVVRFRDEGGFLTDFVSDFAKTEALYECLIEQYGNAGRFRRPLISFCHRRVSKDLMSKRNKQKEIAVRQLDAVLNTTREVAVETPERDFRMIKRAEIGVVLDAARRASGAWIFIFHPNLLLAQKNQVIAYAM